MSAGLPKAGLSWRLRTAMIVLAAIVVGAVQLCSKTAGALGPRTDIPFASLAEPVAPELRDRNGHALNVTFENEWNVHDVLALHDIPAFLRLAFIHAEDKRFYEHHGPDWLARGSAAVTNIVELEAVRGASTITEQVLRMIEPRPRTVWSRWIEGFAATRLEQAASKDEILAFYLNQVPYAAGRRGVAQAAGYYFSRDVGTLSQKEMLALAVLVRSPSRLDLYRSPDAVQGGIERLADLMVDREVLSAARREEILEESLELRRPQLAVSAPHFIRFVRSLGIDGSQPNTELVTTLDADLQSRMQRLLDARVGELAGRGAEHAGLLVVENASREVRAWVVAGGGEPEGPRSHVDAVLTPRQPGSALKPFLYALALEKGWTAARIIDDAPLAAGVGAGLHEYTNYSRRFYGPVTLRDALGNSLNIPALRTLHFVGIDAYLDTLAALGFDSLDAHADFYGDGIALGNGAVSLYELTQAYVALANAGRFAPLRVLAGEAHEPGPAASVFSPESASLIAHILSDPDARALEFGRDGVLGLPVQTAVKTGTSSDFRDAWAVGFNSRYSVGIWIGHLDQLPTEGLTGSTGPGLLLRGVFAELNRERDIGPLYLSPKLGSRQVCVPMPGAGGACIERSEWFAPGTTAAVPEPADDSRIAFRRPRPGLELAMDPRLPDEAEAFEFALDGVQAGDRVQWIVDGEQQAGEGARLLWPMAPGTHTVSVTVLRAAAAQASLPALTFHVK